MVDDVLSLVILAVLQQLDGSDQDVWLLLQPVVVSLGFGLVGVVLIKAVPGAILFFEQWHPACKQDNALLFVSLGLIGALTLAAGYAGTTFLLGTFVAGMALSTTPRVTLALCYFQPLTEWLSTVFFVSIGLVVPVKQLFSPLGIGYGLLYTLPAFLGKAVTGVLAPPGQKTVVAAAMVGRGELGFLMAQEAFDDDLIDELTFATCVWALLLCTLVSPFLMKWLLEKQHTAPDDIHRVSDNERTALNNGPTTVTISMAV
jgi:Kef-type K+ transport system membrane component KefB